MAVSPHPSVKPTKPRKPPSDREGQGARMSGQAGVSYGAKHEFHGSYDHDKSLHQNEYGHGMKAAVHGMGDHKSEFQGPEGAFPKASDKDMK